uniref:YubB ferredoxin-like domain-containing protein n=1 Tax=Lotharella oceanica TaxID=641309 RepID=A0A7S2TFS4_9EUKA
MPNFCENTLKVRGSEQKLIDEFYEKNKSETTELAFEKSVPIDGSATENWGTKWSAREVIVDKSEACQMIYSFLTAWSPPIPWLKKVIEKYPTLNFELEFEEPGMDFGGYYRHENGNCEEKEYALTDHYWGKFNEVEVGNIVQNVVQKMVEEGCDDNDEIVDAVVEELADDPDPEMVRCKLAELVQNAVAAAGDELIESESKTESAQKVVGKRERDEKATEALQSPKRSR